MNSQLLEKRLALRASIISQLPIHNKHSYPEGTIISLYRSHFYLMSKMTKNDENGLLKLIPEVRIGFASLLH